MKANPKPFKPNWYPAKGSTTVTNSGGRMHYLQACTCDWVCPIRGKSFRSELLELLYETVRVSRALSVLANDEFWKGSEWEEDGETYRLFLAAEENIDRLLKALSSGSPLDKKSS